MRHIINEGLIVTIVLSVVLFFSSCHKKNTSFDFNQAIETVSDYVEAQQMTDLLLNTYFKSITDSTLLTDGEAEIDGANISYSTDPAIIIINYLWHKGDGYGHYRKGIYEASSESGFFDSLAIVNFTFSNFFYDFDSIAVGSLSITNLGLNADGNYLFNVDATDIYREFHDTTGHIVFQLQQDFIRNKDTSSPYYTDNDFFKISGNLTGVARNGKSFSSIVQDTASLRSSYACRWLNGGTSEIELPEFIYNATANFSNEVECLNQYSVITNGSLFIKAFDKKMGK